jgi:putative glutathione S-transferase
VLTATTTTTTTTTFNNNMTSVTNNLRTDRTGAYNRHDAKHRHTKGDPVPCENGRYHLHVALACPWAAGALAVVYLKGLEGVVSHSIVHPTWGKTKPDDDADKHHGWVYRKPGDAPMTSPTGNGSFECDAALVPDMVTNVATVREVFELNGDTTGPFTTPLLWDNKDKRIVSNESTESKR